MTAAIVAAVQAFRELDKTSLELDNATEPSLHDPALGKPISHTQLITVSRVLQKHDDLSPSIPSHLDELLRGSKVYYEPPEPKAEPTTEYKALMARLNREEEARSYERMINPPPPLEAFHQRFPGHANAKLFEPSRADIGEDDEVTYADINRQLALIINIVVSIVACSVAIWMAARHWNTPARLGVSMGGSGMIGVAEVVVYAGYLRRLKEAQEKGKKEVETKEIMETWIIGGGNKEETEPQYIDDMQKAAPENQVRKRVAQAK